MQGGQRSPAHLPLLLCASQPRPLRSTLQSGIATDCRRHRSPPRGVDRPPRAPRRHRRSDAARSARAARAGSNAARGARRRGPRQSRRARRRPRLEGTHPPRCGDRGGAWSRGPSSRTSTSSSRAHARTREAATRLEGTHPPRCGDRGGAWSRGVALQLSRLLDAGRSCPRPVPTKATSGFEPLDPSARAGIPWSSWTSVLGCASVRALRSRALATSKAARRLARRRSDPRPRCIADGVRRILEGPVCMASNEADAAPSV